MSDWLDPVARALDERRYPLDVFVRDDDAGWADDRLTALLDVFADRAFPIDLAVIPTAVRPPLVEELLQRLSQGAPIGLHQHGFMHANHEVQGRACEFGPARSPEAQRDDILAGRRILSEQFGDRLDPVFTPPWNRCAGITGRILRECGFTAISRDVSAGLMETEGLIEQPIRVDWFAKKAGVPLSPGQWADALAAEIERVEGPLGLMLHHAPMDAGAMHRCDALLQLLSAHPQVHGVLMREAAAALTASGR